MFQIKKPKLNLTQTITLIVSVSLTVLLVTLLVRAWIEPSDIPPGGTVFTPVYTGPTAQTKEGVLKVKALSTYDETVSDNTIETGTLCLGNGTNCQSDWPSGGSKSYRMQECYVTKFRGNDPSCTATCPAGYTIVSFCKGAQQEYYTDYTDYHVVKVKALWNCVMGSSGDCIGAASCTHSLATYYNYDSALLVKILCEKSE